MQATKDTVVTIDYELRDAYGEIVDKTTADAPLAYLHGHANIIPGLEQAIQDHAQGETLHTKVPPELAYGFYDEQRIQKLSRSQFEGVDDLSVGMSFEAMTEQGPAVATITDISGDQVTVDSNHMLADQTLSFKVRILDIRAATPQEIDQGYADTPN